MTVIKPMTLKPRHAHPAARDRCFFRRWRLEACGRRERGRASDFPGGGKRRWPTLRLNARDMP